MLDTEPTIKELPPGEDVLALVRLRAHFSERAFAQSPALAPIGQIAGAHHERLVEVTVGGRKGELGGVGWQWLGGEQTSGVRELAELVDAGLLHGFAFMEKAGDRWWPIGGGVYYALRAGSAAKQTEGAAAATDRSGS